MLSAAALGTLAIRRQVSKSRAVASAPASLARVASEQLRVEPQPVVEPQPIVAPALPPATAALDGGAVAEEARAVEAGSVVAVEVALEVTREAGALEVTAVHAIAPQDLPRAPEPTAFVSPVRWSPPRRPAATPHANDIPGQVHSRRPLDREDPWSE